MNPSANQQNWHWERGITFALEGVKAILLINGAAAVSVLTFIGNERGGSPWLVSALVLFACGAASAVPTMIFGYLTQLHYGNASDGDDPDAESWQTAQRYHFWAYGLMGVGILCFLVGMALGARGLLHLHREPLPCTHALIHKSMYRQIQGGANG